MQGRLLLQRISNNLIVPWFGQKKKTSVSDQAKKYQNIMLQIGILFFNLTERFAKENNLI